MRSSDNPSRYVLVPRTPEAEPARNNAGARPIRRYSLARVAVSPRSALGEDRHERLERVAGRDQDPGGS
jgi:hypothetical protein